MISFWREDTKIVVHVEHGIFHDDNGFNLEINQSQIYQAELLKRQFQENLNRHLRNIKEDAYNAGWKDAKAKTKKRTSFWGGWKF